MSIGMLLESGEGVSTWVAWAARFARASSRSVTLIELQEHEEGGVVPFGQAEPSPLMEAARAATEAMDGMVWRGGEDAGGEEDEDGVVVRAVTVRGPDPTLALVHEVPGLSLSLLLLPRTGKVKGANAQEAPVVRLYRRAPCDVAYLRVNGEPKGPLRVLVPTDGTAESDVAFRWGLRLAGDDATSVRLVEVESDVDAYVREAGKRRAALRSARARRADRVVPDVVLAEDVAAALGRLDTEPHDLVLCGATGHREARRLLFGALPDDAESPPASLAVVRPAIPLAGRLRQYMERRLRKVVPQLDREARLALVDRVAPSSSWDFDFVALTSLSTVIAASGLVLDSTAVVIGAMLVAPLMTPLLGAGLSLVQGNVLLLRTSARSVFRGFFLALLLGALTGGALRLAESTGWFVSFHDPTDQMLARGSPTVLDLFVAYVSGVAAAYANGRPHLLAALPGVAIAAALVPPIAAAGLALALGEMGLAFGASLLFLANIVAIVLGASTSLWFVGIRDDHQRHGGNHRTRRVSVVLILATVLLSVTLTESRTQLAADQEQLVAEFVADEFEGRLERAIVRREGGDVVVALKLSAPVPPSRAGLDALARRLGTLRDETVKIRAETRLSRTSR